MFARSIFLQGAAFIDPEKPPPALAGLASAVRQLNEIAREAGIPAGALALQAASGVEGVRSVVVGVNSKSQLLEIMDWATTEIDKSAIADAMRVGDGLPAESIDPRNWPQRTG